MPFGDFKSTSCEANIAVTEMKTKNKISIIAIIFIFLPTCSTLRMISANITNTKIIIMFAIIVLLGGWNIKMFL